MGNRGHLKPHFFEITLMQFVNILEIPLMRFLSISEMEFVAPESRLKQQEAITTTTVKRITATNIQNSKNNYRLAKHEATRILPCYTPRLETDQRMHLTPLSSKRDHCLRSFSMPPLAKPRRRHLRRAPYSPFLYAAGL